MARKRSAAKATSSSPAKREPPPAPPPADASIYIARGNDLLADRDYEGARRHFDAAVRLDPALARARYGRALAWHYLNELDHALDDYDGALRLDPRHCHALYGRASVRRTRRDLDAAIADYTRILEIDPAFAGAYEERARVRAQRGEHALAAADRGELLRLQHDRPDHYRARAESWQSLGQAERALEDLGEAIRLDPLCPRTLEARAAVHRGRGNHELAEADTAAARLLDSAQIARANAQRQRTLIATLLREHFHPIPATDLAITERVFPSRVRADLQRALDALLASDVAIAHFCGLPERHGDSTLVGLMSVDRHDPATVVAPQYEDLDVGEPAPVRCLKNGLWLLVDRGCKLAAILLTADRHGMSCGYRFQVAASADPAGTQATQAFFRRLEEAVQRSESYRGKVLSLEAESPYHGLAHAVLVHRIRPVSRDEVILPASTVELIDRNAIDFVRRREALRAFGLPTKKGLLLYGPPGTGKTHTIHYLIGALPGHTTLLITAGQMGALQEYMVLARLLQPSIVVIEDVDLIARDREQIGDPMIESLLNRLLNEMDGLKPDADILFILTTNRPNALESALASRPGRVDQAIEFPLPDEAGRAKLVRLYASGLTVGPAAIADIVRRTDGVSASFIRELLRRVAQFHLERGGTGEIGGEDIDAALQELLVTGGSLNRRLLGAKDG